MPTEKTADLPAKPDSFERLFEKIREVGFPLVGAVDLELAYDAFGEHSARYQEWIAAGMHGDMGYLERGLERRLDPRKVFPATKSVIACAIPYRRADETPVDEDTPRYARYLQGPDYHLRLPELLSSALKDWADEFAPNSADVAKGGAPNPDRPKWKVCVDTSAVLERSWAALTGLGWIGKNTLLIHPAYGSYLFLATILIDRESGLVPAPHPNYCGNCTRCIDGCPTSAIIRAGTLDSRKCISYLTLEKRGEWQVDPELKKKMGNWVAGCDICQEVCPFNGKPARLPETWPSDERDSSLTREWPKLVNESEVEYRARIAGSALSRIKFPDMRRNLENARRNLSRPSDSSDS